MQLDLPFTVLSVSLRALETVQLPPFAGSKLEGAFGRALYQLACTQPHLQTCQGCSLHQICPYGLSYEPALPPQIQASSLGTPPRPVIFRVAFGQERWIKAGEVLTFGLVVVGKAVLQLPYFLAALREVGQQGLGISRGRLELEQVVSVQPYTHEQKTLMTGTDFGMQLQPISLNVGDLPQFQATRLSLHLQSLLHIKVDGKMAQKIHFPVFIRALQRRISNLEQVHGGALSLGADFSRLPLLAKQVETVDHDLYPVSQLRKGSRPKEKTSMEGLMGRLEFAGDFAPFMPLLRYGEQLGIGKWAHFGAGLYSLKGHK